MSQNVKSSFSFGTLIVILCSVFIGGQGCRGPQAKRECVATGRESMIAYVDGVMIGGFESLSKRFTASGQYITLKGGIIPFDHFLKDWKMLDPKNPLLSESHDVILNHYDPVRQKILNPRAELVGAKLVSIDWQPTSDRKDCLLVNKMTLQVQEVRVPDGVWTSAR
jgi:hypothetical protein